MVFGNTHTMIIGAILLKKNKEEFSMHINELFIFCSLDVNAIYFFYLPNQNIEVILCATIGGVWGQGTTDGDLIVCLDKP